MLKEIKEKISNIKKSPEYKKWINNNKEAYLCSVFCLSQEEDNWQVDFYDTKTKLITNFFLQNNIILENTDKVFSKTQEKINELNIDEVKVDLDKIMNLIDSLVKGKYKNETAYKKIVILQNLTEILWNITIIMSSFNILNVKISAKDGKILEEHLSSVFNFTS